MSLVPVVKGMRQACTGWWAMADSAVGRQQQEGRSAASNPGMKRPCRKYRGSGWGGWHWRQWGGMHADACSMGAHVHRNLYAALRCHRFRTLFPICARFGRLA